MKHAAPAMVDADASPGALPAAFAAGLESYANGELGFAELRRRLANELYDDLAPADAMLKAIAAEHEAGRITDASRRALAAEIHRLTSEQLPTDHVQADPVAVPATRPGARAAMPGPRAAEPQQRATPQLSVDGIAPAPKLPEGINPGTVLSERYEISQHVSHSLSADVFLARDLRRVEAADPVATVVVKVLAEDMARPSVAARAMQRQALVLQRIAHPHIVKVLDVDRTGRHGYIVMEWLHGETLAERLDRAGTRGLSPADAGRLLGGVADALAAVHAAGVVHGDIKPANIFLSDDGVPKLLDFGFEQAADPGRPARLTPEYASCELLEGEAPEPADDVFAFACTAYRLLAGYRPFGNRNALEAEADGAVARRPGGLRDAQWRTLESALAFRRAHRCVDVKVLADTLFAPDGRGARGRAGGWRAVAAVAAGLAVAAGATLWNREAPAPRISKPTAASPGAEAPAGPPAAVKVLPPVEDPAVATRRPAVVEAGPPPREPGLARVTGPGAESAGAGETPDGLAASDVAPALPGSPTATELAAITPAAGTEPAPPDGRRGFARRSQTVPESAGFVRLEVAAWSGGAPVTVDFRIEDGSALAGEDYEPPRQSYLVLDDALPTDVILIPLVSDARAEAAESFTVTLIPRDPSLSLRNDRVTVTIVEPGSPDPSVFDPSVFDPSGDDLPRGGAAGSGAAAFEPLPE